MTDRGMAALSGNGLVTSSIQPSADAGQETNTVLSGVSPTLNARAPGVCTAAMAPQAPSCTANGPPLEAMTNCGGNLRPLNRRPHPHPISAGPKAALGLIRVIDTSASKPDGDRPGGASLFPTTHWSVVFEAAHPESPGSLDAFARLYRDYWHPLYGYIRRRGRGPHVAEELTQGFFVSLIEHQRLHGLERGGGRFRSFLLKALQNFLANEWDRATALKRGGGCAVIPLEEVEAESRFLADPTPLAPEAGFERAWACAVIENAMCNLESELRAAGKSSLFERLRPCLQGDRSGRPYAEIGAELGMTEGAVKVAVHRLRQRYGELLRAEVARTVASEADIAEELRHLIAIVSAG